MGLVNTWGERNPLHGVERSQALRDPGLLIGIRIHYMELKDNHDLLALAKLPWHVNPLHGVERRF